MPIFCALDWNRTNDLLLRRQTLYPLSYEGIQGSCRYRRDVLELSRKVASNGKSALNCGVKCSQCPYGKSRDWPALRSRSVAGERIHMDPAGARATCRGPQRTHAGGRAGDEDFPAADVGDQLLEGRRVNPSVSLRPP